MNAEFVSDADDDYLLLQPNDIKGGLGNNSGNWTVYVTVTAPATAAPPLTPIDPNASTTSTGPTKVGDAFVQAVLLQHLNDNRGYYNRVVWLMMDTSDRQMFVESALEDYPSLVAGIDTVPLAVSGNIVAFPYDGTVPNWADEKPDDANDSRESIVTLPTRGVFAEAMLGHCNACEKRDVTRMWDWTEMTEEEPPAISDVTPGPRGTAPDIAQGTLPQNVIQISQPPAAPDPTGLAAALRVLGTPNIFRDETGLQEVSSLLNTLANGAVTTLAGAQKVAQQAQQKLQAVQGQQGQSGIASGGTQSRPTAAQTYDNLTAAKEIASAAKDLGWTPQTTEAVTSDVVEGGQPFSIPGMLAQTILGKLPGPSPSAWPQLDQTTVLDRLKVLMNDANYFNQGAIGLCTAAAFFHHIIQKNPLSFYLFGTASMVKGWRFLAISTLSLASIFEIQTMVNLPRLPT